MSFPADDETVRKGDREIHHNRKILWLLLALPAISFAVACFAFSNPVHAAQSVPYKINFQGRLTNASGLALSGTHEMQIKLYTLASGGTYVWGETRTTANGNAVTVTNGIFSLLIGEGTAVAGSSASLQAAVTANMTLFAEVTVGAEVLSPRNQLGSSAYAFNSDTIDGIDGASLAQLGTANTFTTSNASAFVVNSGSSNIFKVDTTGTGQVVVGTTDANGTVLVLDTKNDNATDPTGANGAMYYNSTAGKFRCYQASAWADCITPVGGATLQTAYNGSGTPATITTTAAKGVMIVAGAVPTADLFSIDNSGQAVTTANVNGLSVNYVGGAANVEASGIRVDLTPGGTSGGTWSGLRIVANATGPFAGVTEYGIKLEGSTVQGAGTETGMYIGTGWDTGLDVQSGGLNLAGYTSGGNPADPATPTGDNLRVYAKKVSGRMLLKMKGPSGLDTPLQPALFGNNIVYFAPGTGATITANANGFGTSWTKGSSTGTASTTTPSTTAPVITNQMHYFRHQNLVTTTNQIMGIQIGATDGLQFWRGNAAGLGGFFFNARFVVAAYPASTVRIFAGLTSTANSAVAGTNIVTADAVVGNVVGLWHDTTDPSTGANSFNLVTRNNTTTTKQSIPLSNAIAAGNSYDFYMFVKPNDGTVYYRLDDMVNGVSYEGNTATTMPLNTAFMGPAVEMSNGTANITVGSTAIGISRIYIESDR